MTAAFTHPDTDAIRELLARARTIAVVGYSPNPLRPSHLIANAMRDRGYRVIAVRPGIDTALGERAYARLEDIAVPIDIVDVFRSPEHVPAIVDACIARPPQCLWLQDGVIHPEGAARAQAHGIMVVMNRCIARDYRMLGVQRTATT